MINLDELGSALTILRNRSGLMQKEIAARTGMSRSQVSRYERSRDVPNLVTLVRFLDTVGANLSDLHAAMHQVRTGTVMPPQSSVQDLLRSMLDEELLRPIVGSLVIEFLDVSLESRLAGLDDQINSRTH